MTTTELKEKEDVKQEVASSAPAENEATPIEEIRLRPAADVYRSPDAVRILLDVPGASDQDLNVEVHDGVLSIEARVERSEDQTRVYERSFRVDRRMDTGNIEAELRRGVLALNVPFHEEARPRRIEVKSS